MAKELSEMSLKDINELFVKFGQNDKAAIKTVRKNEKNLLNSATYIKKNGSLNQLYFISQCYLIGTYKKKDTTDFMNVEVISGWQGRIEETHSEEGLCKSPLKALDWMIAVAKMTDNDEDLETVTAEIAKASSQLSYKNHIQLNKKIYQDYLEGCKLKMMDCSSDSLQKLIPSDKTSNPQSLGMEKLDIQDPDDREIWELAQKYNSTQQLLQSLEGNGSDLEKLQNFRELNDGPVGDVIRKDRSTGGWIVFNVIASLCAVIPAIYQMAKKGWQFWKSDGQSASDQAAEVMKTVPDIKF